MFEYLNHFNAYLPTFFNFDKGEEVYFQKSSV